ncbi:MAG: hypothetical protein MI919_16300 [Holophagales bacterium]|nr:hypothetical protein [Holophagales bacterium]
MQIPIRASLCLGMALSACAQGVAAEDFLWVAHRGPAGQLVAVREESLRITSQGSVQLAVVGQRHLLTVCEGKLPAIELGGWPLPEPSLPEPGAGERVARGPGGPTAVPDHQPAVREVASSLAGSFRASLLDPRSAVAEQLFARARETTAAAHLEPAARGIYARARPLPHTDPRIEPAHVSIETGELGARPQLASILAAPLRWLRLGEDPGSDTVLLLGREFERRRPLRIAVGGHLYSIRFLAHPRSRDHAPCSSDELLPKG